MEKSKKGISPLIATVLIIGFTVALAAVIMNFGTSFTKGIQKSTSESATGNMACAQDVSLTIKGVCISGTQYQITTTNDGSADITEFKIRLYKSENEAKSFDSVGGLESFSLGKILNKLEEVDTTLYPGVKKVELIPYITVSGSSVACSSNIVSYGDSSTSGVEFTIC